MLRPKPQIPVIALIIISTIAWGAVCYFSRGTAQSHLLCTIAIVAYIATTAGIIVLTRKQNLSPDAFDFAQGKARLLSAIGTPTSSEECFKKSLVEIADETFNQLENLRQAQNIIVENASDIICSLDEEGKICELNSGAERIWGYLSLSLIGMPMDNMIPTPDRPRFSDGLKHCSEKQETEAKFDTQILAQTGHRLDIAWTIEWSPTLKRFYCIGHDTTPLKQIERLRAEFTAMISHDLRSPVSALSFLLQGILSGDYGTLNEDGRARVMVCQDNIDQLLRLINSLLDAEKLDSGQLELKLSPLPLAAIVEASVNLFEPIAERKKTKILHSDTGTFVEADFDRSVQILSNLLSNALKWSPNESQIVISESDFDEYIRISVKDNGPGIPDEQQDKIFERFQMLDETQSPASGSGLGLYVAKSLSELQGGRVGVESKVGAGSTFWFMLKRSSEDDA